ncbi:MAG: transketolase [Sulfuriferula sp.]|nr:transketolase [Sulfuriferula sp.]
MNDTAVFERALAGRPIDDLCIATLRTLAMDAVQLANSGHPGTPMALAPLAYVLWTKSMRYNPENPAWFNRDRFVLSAGHASMLLYAALHLVGYDISLDDLRQFRQWGSKTPGHPEYALAHGVETTTGPLGQGIMTAVGMAIAEAHLAAVYNRDGHDIVNHSTYVVCSDGDLMEGASHEAAALAGHLGLGKLICMYDDNHITIEGDTALAYSDDVAARFAGYHWHVQDIGDQANDTAALEAAIGNAQAEQDRPSLIIIRSHIAYGAPHLHDSAKAHGAPLGAEEVRLTKRTYGWPEDAEFFVPAAVSAYMRTAIAAGRALEQSWQAAFADYRTAYPQLAAAFEAALDGTPPAGWADDLPEFSPVGSALATRSASGKVLNRIAGRIPWLMGGSADLAPSTDTLLSECGDFARGQYAQRNMHWGIREHVMCAASSGMALHGGVRPYAASFFIFTDYARPAIRLAALMGLPVIYVMTHDSIGLGEDGPTHQPVEQLAALRAMPNLTVIRPADANETVYAWRAAIERRDGPTMLVLTRQSLPVLDRTRMAPAEGLLRGAYVLIREQGIQPAIIVIATGSELHVAVAAHQKMAEIGIDARIVSMPSWELFRAQPQSYRDEVLPPQIKARLSIEAAATFGWCEWVGDPGMSIGIDHFGASAPGPENFQHFGFTVEHIVALAAKQMDRGMIWHLEH